MKRISIVLFCILSTGLMTSVIGIDLSLDQACIGLPVTITGIHPYGDAGRDIFLAVYSGYSGAAPLPGPGRSGAELETLLKTEEGGKWRYQFVPNYIPGEYLIYADGIGTGYHETLLIPIMYCDTPFIEPVITPEQEVVPPQPEPTEIPTLSDTEVATPLSLFSVLVGILSALGIAIQKSRLSIKGVTTNK